jgi:hypothetical protein
MVNTKECDCTFSALYLGGSPMAKSPKIKIKLPPGYPAEDAFELEEAKSRLNFDKGMILVDGQRVKSYEDLVRLAKQDKYKNKEFIEVDVILLVAGG